MDDLDIPMLSLETRIGNFHIDADPAILQMKVFRNEGRDMFILRHDAYPDFSKRYSEIFDAIKAVANHKTGLPDWDDSTEVASDYLNDWQKQINKKIKLRLLNSWLQRWPKGSMRQCVDYFERKHGYMNMDRMVLYKLFSGMLKNGQLKELPDMHMAPSEMKGLTLLAKKYLDKSTDPKAE